MLIWTWFNSHDLVVVWLYRCGIWTGKQIYWTHLLITIQSNTISHTLQFTTAVYCCLFTSPMVLVSNCGNSLQVFPNCSHALATVHSLHWNFNMLAPLRTLKSSLFWDCSGISSTCHWLHPPIICFLVMSSLQNSKVDQTENTASLILLCLCVTMKMCVVSLYPSIGVCHIAPSLGLFVPNSIAEYHSPFFPK